jgi:hypothetical protein
VINNVIRAIDYLFDGIEQAKSLTKFFEKSISGKVVPLVNFKMFSIADYQL